MFSTFGLPGALPKPLVNSSLLLQPAWGGEPAAPREEGEGPCTSLCLRPHPGGFLTPPKSHGDSRFHSARHGARPWTEGLFLPRAPGPGQETVGACLWPRPVCPFRHVSYLACPPQAGVSYKEETAGAFVSLSPGAAGPSAHLALARPELGRPGLGWGDGARRPLLPCWPCSVSILAHRPSVPNYCRWLSSEEAGRSGRSVCGPSRPGW